MEEKIKKERIGVYICHCGGNISDYVDVAQIKDLVKKEDGVIVCETGVKIDRADLIDLTKRALHEPNASVYERLTHLGYGIFD